MTLREAFNHYRNTYLRRLKAGTAITQDIERDYIKALGHKPLDAITRADLAKVLDVMEERGPIQANRVLGYTKAMFNRFVERGLLEVSPAAALRKRAKEVPRERVLSDEEMTALWHACDIEGSWLGPFIKLLALTGMRRGEPIAAKIEGNGSRLNLDVTKQGARHVVVLPRQARGLLEAAREAGLAGVTNPKTLGWTQRWDRLLKLSGLRGSGITIHDLRRTWATTAARIGVDPLIIELCLGHAPSGVLGRIGAVYNRHSYTDRCAEAWQQVADHIASVVEADAACEPARFAVLPPDP